MENSNSLRGWTVMELARNSVPSFPTETRKRKTILQDFLFTFKFIWSSNSDWIDCKNESFLSQQEMQPNRATLRVRSCRIRPTVNAIQIQDSIQTWTQSNRPIHWVFLLFGYLFIYFLCVFIKWPTFWCRSWGWRRWWVLRGSRRLFRVHSMQFASNSTASNSS